MSWHLLWCVQGSHFWKRERLPGTVPDSCWDHRESPLEGLQTLELWCDAGQHAWQHRRVRGTYPVSCPEHQQGALASGPGGPMAGRWIGDLRTCFLHQDGWAFRVEVNRYQLAGREGWRLPLTFAEHVGLEDRETRTLRPSRQELGDDVWIARRGGTCIGGPIDGPLRRLGAALGDLVFFAARGNTYAMTHRAVAELHDVVPVKRLLWSCGLDPEDVDVLSEPWSRLARALGGSGGAGRDEVRRRLQHRGDDGLLGLLDEAGRGWGEHTDNAATPWPEGWQYRLPPANHAEFPAVMGADQTIRVALGLLDASNQPPRNLVLADGGALWLDQNLVADPEDLLELMRRPPRGLIPTAHRRGWAAMIKAEHAARRLALGGQEWSVAVVDGAWHFAGRSYGSLVAALGTMEDLNSDVVAGPTKGIQTAYPRSAAAVRTASEEAVAQGLRAVVADPACGFRAEYVEYDVTGPALHEVLRRP